MFDANPHPPGGQPAHVTFHADNPALEICRPAAQCVPLVFASPQSGRRYPDALLAASGLDLPALRASEDAFVDQLFDWVPSLGAPLLLAHFPRVWVDANRDAREIDPAMFLDPVPAAAQIASARVGAGLGVIPKVVADGQVIRNRPLTWAEGAARLAQCTPLSPRPRGPDRRNPRPLRRHHVDRLPFDAVGGGGAAAATPARMLSSATAMAPAPAPG